MTTDASWGGFGVLLLLALSATVQAYASANRAIHVWIAADYQPVFEAGFTLAVVLAWAIRISILVRRLC